MSLSPEDVWPIIETLTRRIRALETAERAETAGGVMASTVAALPALAGVVAEAGRMYFATDGRKTGEGVGVGTGVQVYADGTNATWRRVDDGTAVAA